MKSNSDREARDLFLARGAEALSDEQLLGLVLLRAGEESQPLAERLIASAGSLSALARMPFHELRQLEGLGVERAVRLQAAVELGQRLLISEGEQTTIIHDRNDVVTLFAPLIGRLGHEEMWVLYLASSNRIIERRRISIGGSTGLTTDCKLIIRRALDLVANSIIVVHNHPSGVAEPSEADKEFTQRLQSAAALFDIVLLDHIILSSGESYSFRSSQLL